MLFKLAWREVFVYKELFLRIDLGKFEALLKYVYAGE